jgi:cell division protein FtsI/penicillin-binding protein 2
MHPKTSTRFKIMLIVVALMFSLLVIRVTKLMFFQRDLFAAAPRLANEYERGHILDREGEKLALSLQTYSVYARPRQVEQKKAAAMELSRTLDLPYRAILGSLNRNAPFVWIRRQVDLRHTRTLEELDIPGIYVEKEYRRYYPYRNLASHVIGFSGVDQTRLKRIKYQFDHILRPGRMDEKQAVPRRGGSVTLTIDRFVQEIVEEEVERAYRQTGARLVTGIVMNPETGEVLALANHPSYDLNNFTRYPDQVIRNKAITDLFEPGSTFKVFVAAALMDRDLVAGSDRFDCRGYVNVEGITIHDTGVHGILDFRKVLEKSCNVGMVKSVRRIDRAGLYESLRSFGFGTPTGIQLPGESAGTLRKPSDWSGTSRYAIAIGQEVAVTPLQLVSAASAIANRGVLMQPRIVRKIQGPDGSLLKEYGPLQVRRVLEEETASGLMDMLTGVLSEGGTGYKARIEGYRIAGKTGTAQIADLEHGGYLQGQFYASFLGFVPVPDPRIVILVTLDRPVGEMYGGQTAAPVFKNIVERVAPYLNILPSFSEVYVLKDAS